MRHIGGRNAGTLILDCNAHIGRRGPRADANPPAASTVLQRVANHVLHGPDQGGFIPLDQRHSTCNLSLYAKTEFLNLRLAEIQSALDDLCDIGWMERVESSSGLN